MEILSFFRLFIGSIFLVIGLLFFAVEMYGSFRFDFVLNRMHAAAIGDTLGIGSCFIGLIIFSGLNATSLKLLLVIIFLWIASPVSSHLIARLEITTNEKIDNYCEIKKSEQNDQEKEG